MTVVEAKLNGEWKKIKATGMNDKLFARLLKPAGFTEYRTREVPDPVYEMTDKDRELKDYCDHQERMENAMGY